MRVVLTPLIYQLHYRHPLHTPHFQHGTCLFQPVSTTPHSTVTITPQTTPRPVYRHLSFSSNNDQDPDSTPVYSNSSNDEEDIQTVPLDDEHWTSEELFIYTNRDSHITYANIHALMAAITSLHTWIV